MNFNIPATSKLRVITFTFGVATASFQIEGSSAADGRCESIWDRFCATPGKVLHGDNGEQACDHYRRLEQDLDLIESLGVDAYRFSIAWPRIEPSPGVWNEAGFAFYERLVDGLIARGIKPYATLYHWDLPQYLEDQGGWINRVTAYRFAVYADKVSARLGNRVTSYATFNEPWCSAFLGYRFGVHAPGLESDRLGFQAAHHLLLAHGLALPAMRANAPQAQHGIVLNMTPSYANSDSAEDQWAAEFADAENTHTYLQPLLQGSYPTLVFAQHPDWAPTQLAGDLAIMAAPIDFLGINYYTRGVVKKGDSGDYETVSQPDAKTDIGWSIYPAGLTDLLVDLNARYSNLPPLFITENGAADNTELVAFAGHETSRTDYYIQHRNAVHQAIDAGVDIHG